MDPLEDLSRRAATIQNGIDAKRARVPPWFVGNGKKLMVTVVSLFVGLSALRLETMILLIEQVWQWSHPTDHVRSVSRTPGPTTVVRRIEADDPASSRRPPIPASDAKQANVRVHGNPGQYFGPDSYPPEAIRANEQGRTVADLLIDRSGAPIGCTIRTSSGSRSLDAATCSVAIRRLQFSPARDAKGRPKTSHYTLPVRWVLPSD